MTTKTVKIKTGFSKLDQLLKITGAAGHAKLLVKEGLVKYNGEPCSQRGKKLFRGDEVEVEDTLYVIE